MRDHVRSLAETNIRYWILLMEKQIREAGKPEPPLEIVLRTLDEIDDEEI
jgi:hypothetical protein